jgi:hypothetical protein
MDKYVLYHYDRYTYSSSIDSTTVSIRRGLIYYTYMKSNKLLIIILFRKQTNHMNVMYINIIRYILDDEL